MEYLADLFGKGFSFGFFLCTFSCLSGFAAKKIFYMVTSIGR